MITGRTWVGNVDYQQSWRFLAINHIIKFQDVRDKSKNAIGAGVSIQNLIHFPSSKKFEDNDDDDDEDNDDGDNQEDDDGDDAGDAERTFFSKESSGRWGSKKFFLLLLSLFRKKWKKLQKKIVNAEKKNCSFHKIN